jgi:hypothetical protein
MAASNTSASKSSGERSSGREVESGTKKSIASKIAIRTTKRVQKK